MKMCCGEIDASDIQADSNYNHYATVNMRKCSFTGQPIVFTSMTCTSGCWEEYSMNDIITENNVMNSKEFKLYVRTNVPLSLSWIKTHKWKIRCIYTVVHE